MYLWVMLKCIARARRHPSLARRNAGCSLNTCHQELEQKHVLMINHDSPFYSDEHKYQPSYLSDSSSEPEKFYRFRKWIYLLVCFREKQNPCLFQSFPCNICSFVIANDHTLGCQVMTQQVVQNFITWPCFPCMWRQCHVVQIFTTGPCLPCLWRQ